MSTQSTLIADIELVDDSFLYIRYKQYVEVTSRDAEELIKNIAAVKKEACPRVYHYNKNMSFQFDAIRTLAASSTATAVAVLHEEAESSEVLKAIREVFTHFKLNCPVRFFRSMSEACTWAQEMSTKP